ncbi:MAG: hypothetical protein E7321_04025 [Clostridiales bacterium]|nr:hypothetical protein [Clostridiales bacterium]
MEKKIWSMPEVQVAQFAAEEYISSCRDDLGRIFYNFICDATIFALGEKQYWPSGLGIQGKLIIDGSEQDDGTIFKNGVADDSDDWVRGFQACGTSTSGEGDRYTIENKDEFVSGFYVPWGYDVENGDVRLHSDAYYTDENGVFVQAIPVTIWLGEAGNVHATTQMTFNSTNAAKS